MIIDISDSTFKKILNDERLFLPIRWDGLDFSDTLEKLFHIYIKQLETNVPKNEKGKWHPEPLDIQVDISDIKRITELLIRAVRCYLNGFPANAFDIFTQVMESLIQTPLQIYQKSVLEQFDHFGYHEDDELNLFRAVKVQDNKPYERTRAFHTPYNLRSKVSTSRYSIAGYPSLYLGTSLELCCKEIGAKYNDNYIIASLFKLERTIEYSNTNIQVIELGVKPQDFLAAYNDNRLSRRYIPSDLLKDDRTKSIFLLWYPLIAACSFIRVNKKDPFAAEYIIPQLLMQWVRSEMRPANALGREYDQLIGIRYFSCASVRASEMGFNYVFPTSGKQKSADLPYCAVLAKAFCLTRPLYINEFDSIASCEKELSRSTDFDYIG